MIEEQITLFSLLRVIFFLAVGGFALWMIGLGISFVANNWSKIQDKIKNKIQGTFLKE